jgi:hypothetical protein
LRIRLDDRALLGDLLMFLRREGCVAYLIEAADAIETLTLDQSAADTARALIQRWSTAHPAVKIGLECTVEERQRS